MVTRSGKDRDESSREEDGIQERVVKISRVSKVVKGGRRLSFSAVVVVGDGDGNVGIGMGKATAVPDAVRKGVVKARNNMIKVPLEESTIPHEVISKYRSSEVMLKPASAGTGVIAGGSVRAVVELAGIKDITTKARFSTNPVNTVKATFQGLKMLRRPIEEIKKRKDLAETIPTKPQYGGRGIRKG